MRDLIAPVVFALAFLLAMVCAALGGNNVIVIPGENGCREEITENRRVFGKDTIDRVIICETRK